MQFALMALSLIIKMATIPALMRSRHEYSSFCKENTHSHKNTQTQLKTALQKIRRNFLWNSLIFILKRIFPGKNRFFQRFLRLIFLLSVNKHMESVGTVNFEDLWGVHWSRAAWRIAARSLRSARPRGREGGRGRARGMGRGGVG